MIGFNFHQITFGNEAIKFQPTKEKHKTLTNIFQAAINFRDTLDYSKKGELSEIDFRDKKIYKYCKDTLTPQFKTYCKEQWNIEVTNLYINENLDKTGSTKSISGMFAIYLGMKDAENVAKQMERYSGSSTTYGDPDKEFSKLVEVFNEDTGKLKDTGYGPSNYKRPILVDVYFDQVTAFQSHDFLNNRLIGDQMTAAEIAAIMLHEVGHLNTLVDHSADLYYRTSRIVSHIEDISKIETLDDFKNIVIPKTKEILSTIKVDDKNKQMHAKLNDAVNAIDYVLRESDESHLSTFGVLLLNILIMLMIAICKIATILMLGTSIIFMRLSNELYYDTSTSGAAGNKVSDTLSGKRNQYHVERLADEFVSRLGAGGELASGLNKLGIYFKVSGTQIGISNSRLNKSILYAILIKTISMVDILLCIYPSTCMYEDDVNRVIRLLQNNMMIYKNALTPQIRDLYIKDAEAIMKELAKAKSNRNRLYMILDWFLSVCPITSPGKFIIKLSTGNLTNEIDKMLKSAESIIGTKLNYHGAKFDQLAASRGVESIETWEQLIEYSNG